MEGDQPLRSSLALCRLQSLQPARCVNMRSPIIVGSRLSGEESNAAKYCTPDDGAGPGPLSLQPAHRHRRRARSALRRCVRDLRSRQRHLPLGSARIGSGPVADLARPERAIHGARRHRLRQGQAPSPDHDRHVLDRPGRAQHGHGGRHGPRQPAADPDPRGRYLHQPPARSGPPAGRALRRPHRHRERRLQGGLALLGPDLALGAAHGLDAAGHRHHARSGRLRPGLHRTPPGHPGDRLRLPAGILRRQGLDHPAPARRPRARGRSRRAPEDGDGATHHRGRRRALFRCRGGRCRLCRRARDPRRRDHRRQGLVHPLRSRPLRPHRGWSARPRPTRSRRAPT